MVLTALRCGDWVPGPMKRSNAPMAGNPCNPANEYTANTNQLTTPHYSIHHAYNLCHVEPTYQACDLTEDS